MNDQQAQRLLAKISEAIVETVNEAPNGAPCGPLYMALMHVWPSMTSEQFNTLIATLVAAGKVTRVGHVLYMNTNQSCNAAKRRVILSLQNMAYKPAFDPYRCHSPHGFAVFYGAPHWPSACLWLVPGTIDPLV